MSHFLVSLRDLHRGQEVPFSRWVLQSADPVPVRVLPAEPAPEDHPEEPHRAPLGPAGLEIPGQGGCCWATGNSSLEGLARAFSWLLQCKDRALCWNSPLRACTFQCNPPVLQWQERLSRLEQNPDTLSSFWCQKRCKKLVLLVTPTRRRICAPKSSGHFQKSFPSFTKYCWALWLLNTLKRPLCLKCKLCFNLTQKALQYHLLRRQ